MRENVQIHWSELSKVRVVGSMVGQQLVGGVSLVMSFSWVVDKKLAVGPAPRTYEKLEVFGFTAAVNLQEDSEPGPAHHDIPAGFTVNRIPIRDGILGGIPTVGQIAAAVESLNELLRKDVVYVHCFAGVGRSPLICMGYLARYDDKTLEEALQLLHEVHPPTHPNRDQLESLAAYLAGGNE